MAPSATMKRGLLEWNHPILMEVDQLIICSVPTPIQYKLEGLEFVSSKFPLKISSIGAARIKKEDDDNNDIFDTVLLSCWSRNIERKKGNKLLDMVFSINVTIPKSWTTKMYLGLVALSIKSNLKLSFIAIEIGNRTSIQDINNFFDYELDKVQNYILNSGVYYYVQKGSKS